MVGKASLPRHSTDLVGLWGHCNAYHGLEAELGVWGYLEGEFLEQRCEEEEELSTGEHLSQAGTFSCGDSNPQHPQTLLLLLKMLCPPLGPWSSCVIPFLDEFCNPDQASQ